MAVDSKYDDGTIRAFIASGTIAQNHYVKLTAGSEGVVEECDSEGEAVWGVNLDYGVTDGKRCDIFVGPGYCQVQAGVATTVNTNQMTDADGETMDIGGDDYSAGMGMQAASAANALIEVFLYGPSHLDQVGQ